MNLHKKTRVMRIHSTIPRHAGKLEDNADSVVC
jgi:hypothetical protein